MAVTFAAENGNWSRDLIKVCSAFVAEHLGAVENTGRRPTITAGDAVFDTVDLPGTGRTFLWIEN